MQPCPALLPSLPLALWNSPKLELNLEHSMWWTSGKMQMHGDTWRHMTTHDHTWRHMMMIVDDYWRLLMMIGEGRNNHWLMSFEPCLKHTYIYKPFGDHHPLSMDIENYLKAPTVCGVHSPVSICDSHSWHMGHKGEIWYNELMPDTQWFSTL